MPVNLDPVDDFQERHGAAKACETARAFMFEYISRLRKKLPPSAANGWEIAQRARSVGLTVQEREQTLADIWHYIIRHEGSIVDPDPECCLMRGLTWLIRDSWGGPGEEYVSEVIHWFLYFVNRFEDHSSDTQGLIRRFFPSPTAG